MERIERSTSPLPRECSATELHGRCPARAVPTTVLPPYPSRSPRPPQPRPFARAGVGAGEGNRTLVVSLEGFCSTIELHPRRVSRAARFRWTVPADGGGGRIRTFEGRAGRFTVCSL